MSICCPKCGSRNLRFSRSRTASERLSKLVGVRALRCRDCHTRFVDKTWKFSDLAYARCPRCWRMDLNRWNEKQCQAPNYMLLALKLGANPYRCEYCRLNFVSFRRRKEKFSFHRWEKRQAKEARNAVPVEPLSGEPAALATNETPVVSEAPEPPAPVSAEAVETPPRMVEEAPSSAAEAIAWRRAAMERKRA